MLNLDGYRVSGIRCISGRSRIFRGRTPSRATQPRIFKTTGRDDPLRRRPRRAWVTSTPILQRVAGAGVPVVEAFLPFRGTRVLVIEDIGGSIARRWHLRAVARRLLRGGDRPGRDARPAPPGAGGCMATSSRPTSSSTARRAADPADRFRDGFRSSPPGVRWPVRPATAHAGTPAYMAPEQTGRMNRGVDHRADFYALGVTFHELLERPSLPFQVGGCAGAGPCAPGANPAAAPERTASPRSRCRLSDIVQKLLVQAGPGPLPERPRPSGRPAALRAGRGRRHGRIAPFELGTDDRHRHFDLAPAPARA